MPDFHNFKVANFTANGLYVNNYHLAGDINNVVNINTTYSSYPWDAYLTPLTHSNLNLTKQKDSTNIAYLNYNKNFLTKQQLEGIKIFKKIFNYDIVYRTPTTSEYNKILFPLIKLFTVPIIVVQADIFSLKVLQYIPIAYKLGIKWQVKQVIINFKNIESFLKEMLRKITPFLSIDISLNEINNIFFNYLNLKTAKTTDHTLHDIFRAIYMEMFIRAIKHLDIVSITSGILILTGEYPAFLKNDSYIYLSLIDGFVLRGLWGIYVDTDFNLIDSLLINKRKQLGEQLLLKIAIPYIDLFFNPIESGKLPMLSLGGVRVKKFFGISNSIVRFKVDSVFNQGSSSIGNSSYNLHFPIAFFVKSLIFDMRKRPIEYGPEAINNKNTVGLALYKLSELMK